MGDGTASTGSAEPLGVTLVPGGANVAVFSAHADAIELCLFDAAGQHERARLRLPARTGDVFHGFVPDIAAGDRYGLRAYGPYDPVRGQRFNAAKLLVDPYARALDRRFALDAAMFGETPAGARNDTDSAHVVPKAIATASPRLAATDRPRVAWADTIIYELHVRGFTALHPDVPRAVRGTCAGLAHPAAIAHLKRLGVTTVELMPLAATIDERHLPRLGLTNYWGYNPAALFVPDPRLAPGGIDELRDCVAALHAAGLEVIVDVVLNHTGESDALGPTVSLRGLDNETYYRLVEGDAGRYVDDAGCGNVLAHDRPAVARLAVDVLRYYAEFAGVDGYRFDLATTLGRDPNGFDPAHPLFRAIAEDPLLADLKLIAEPWDIGPGGYRLGAFPAGWGEWNDRYRDTVRRYWRGDAGCRGALATRLAGSSDVFGGGARAPSSSINFVTAHDGFTLADLVSYEVKHNEANGEDNQDGSNVNYSWNHGVEGPSPDPAIRAARERDVRALLATLFVSRGTPMLAMGDDIGRSQHGDNNAYAQDSALTWVDWANADQRLAELAAALIDLRKRHPALHLDRWLTGAPVDDTGVPDVAWRRPDGNTMTNGDWTAPDAHAFVAILYAPATPSAAADRVIIALNAGRDVVAVRWPAARDGFHWQREIDTSSPTGRPASAGEDPSETDTVAPRSVVVLVEAPNAGRRVRHAGVEPAALDRLAEAAGIAPEWWDIAGRHHVVTADTKRALLSSMQLGVESTANAHARLAELADARERRRLPPVIVGRVGAAIDVPIATGEATRVDRLAVQLVREDESEDVLAMQIDALPASRTTAVDGRIVMRRLISLPPLPVGCHTLVLPDYPESACRVLVVPERCFSPQELDGGARRFGLAAHLYALTRPGDQGIGDFTTLSDVGAATARVGGAVVGINPLHALYGEDRDRASPYHPSDRRFLDPIYIDVRRVPDLATSRNARSLLDASGDAIAALAASAAVDYAAVWRAKRAVLEACFATFERRPADDPRVVLFEQFVRMNGAPLQRFATFEAIAAFHPRLPWPRWPPGLSRPDAPGVARFARQNRTRIRFALYLQWLADRQLADAAAHARASGLGIGLYRDLAIGAAADGAEAWASPEGLARGVSIGAPPDPFSAAGQVWDLPPPIPGSLTGTAYAGFRELVAANMRHAGALRIDHVMGLTRLFWIPDGASAVDGAYVRYPLEDMIGVLAQESHRARCLVVGEDLGTVSEGFRERTAAAGILSYRVVWFEREGRMFNDPSRYPAQAATCVATHDLPTIAGWWSGADIDEKHALGRINENEVAQERGERATAKEALANALDRAGVTTPATIDPMRPHDVAITAAIHRFACATPSALVLLQADDLALETAALNLPGTDRERPNWRRKIGIAAAALWDTPAGIATLAGCTARRRDGVDPG